MLAASSPTGPAFEGAQLSCGQRAAPGVIERVRIDPVTLEPRYRVIGDERWSDEPGFDLAPSGICGSGIVEAIAELFLAGIVHPDGTIDGRLAERSPRIVPTGRTFTYVVRAGEPEIAITQNDVRQIQLAKAALYAGARLLMDRMGIDSVDRVTLAGAFGSQIDPKYALILGMVPDCEPGRVTSAGNAAGYRRPHRASQPAPSPGARTRGAAHREGRDGSRGEVPGALRGRDGDPPPERTLREAPGGGRPAATPARRRRSTDPAAPRPRRWPAAGAARRPSIPVFVRREKRHMRVMMGIPTSRLGE